MNWRDHVLGSSCVLTSWRTTPLVWFWGQKMVRRLFTISFANTLLLSLLFLTATRAKSFTVVDSSEMASWPSLRATIMVGEELCFPFFFTLSFILLPPPLSDEEHTNPNLPCSLMECPRPRNWQFKWILLLCNMP